MGGGMSKKRPPGSGQEALHAPNEEQTQGGSRGRTAIRRPTPPSQSSLGGEWNTRWRKVSYAEQEEGVLQRNGTWGNTSQTTASEIDPSSHADANEPTSNSSGRKEAATTELPFEDCKEVLIGDTPPPAESDPAPAEKRWEWSSLDAWLEPRAQGGAQALSKGTQTEAASTDHEEQPALQSGRDCDSIYMLELAESSEKIIQQGLKELFGFLKILVNIPSLFMLELIHFLGKSIIQMLVVGVLTAVGDQILEPVLSALFNSILQPLLTFLRNVLCSVRDLSRPVIDILKGISLQVAMVLRAFRLVEINCHPRNAMAEEV